MADQKNNKNSIKTHDDDNWNIEGYRQVTKKDLENSDYFASLFISALEKSIPLNEALHKVIRESNKKTWIEAKGIILQDAWSKFKWVIVVGVTAIVTSYGTNSYNKYNAKKISPISTSNDPII